METVLLSLLALASSGIVSAFSLDKLVENAINGSVGGRTDSGFCAILGHIRKRFQNLGDVPVNANLQRAVRRAYLQAIYQTCELAQQPLKTALGHERLMSDRLETIKNRINTEFLRVERADYQLPANAADSLTEQLLVRNGDTCGTIVEGLRQQLQQDAIEEVKTNFIRRGEEIPPTLITLLEANDWTAYKLPGENWFTKLSHLFAKELKTHPDANTFYQDHLLADIKIGNTQIKDGVNQVLEELQKQSQLLTAIQSKQTELSEDVREVLRYVKADSPDLQKLLARLDTANQQITDAQLKFNRVAERLSQNPDDAYFQEDYEDRRSQLNEANRELEKVQADWKTFKESIKTISQQIEQIEEQGNSAQLTEATRLQQEGRISEIYKLFDPEELKGQIKEIENIKYQADAKLKTIARKWLLMANSVKVDFSIPPADRLSRVYQSYRTSVETFPFDENCFAFAHFLGKQNQHSEAIKQYIQALSFINDDDTGYQANIFNNLGTLYRAKNDHAQAETAYNRALSIRERLAQDNPQAYEPDLAMTLNNLGNLYWAKNDHTQAETAYNRALSIYERLAQDNPQAYEPAVAMTLNNLGTLYWAKNDHAQAETAYNRALSIRERLAQDNPQAYESDVAMTLNNLGNLYSDKNEHAQAETAYNRALSIYERLAQDNPQAYEPHLAMTLVNRSILYVAMLQREASIRDAQQCIEIVGKHLHLPACHQYIETAQSTLAFWKKQADDS